MSLLTKLAVSAIVAGVLLVGGIFTGEKLYGSPTFGSTAFTPVGCSQTTISGSGITSTQNTIPVTSFTSQGGVALGMGNFGQIGYLTLDPNSPTKIESVSFTGITQNTNGTAVLTGVTRGLDFVYPYTASTSLMVSHSGGAYVICSNSPAFYQQQFALVNNPSTIAANWTYGSTTPPKYDADPVWANFSTQVFADVSYVNSVVAAGAANGSETVKGIYQLATAAQAALGTSLGSTGARLALGNNLATSTPTFQGTNVIPVTGTNNKLSQLFLDLTQPFTFSALNTFTGRLLSTASSTFTATTTFNGSNVLSNAVIFNGIPYQFPSSQGLAGTSFINNGSGVLTFGLPTASKYSLASTTASNIPINGTVTSATLNIPAGTLTASSTVTLDGEFSVTGTGSGSQITFSVIDSNGNTYISQVLNGPINATETFSFHIVIMANQSLSSQYALWNGTSYATAVSDIFASQTSAVNWANALGLKVQAVVSNNSGSSGSLKGFIMTVNP